MFLKPVEPATSAARSYYKGCDRGVTMPSAVAPTGSECAPKPWKMASCLCQSSSLYLYPTLSSINAPKPGQESEEWLDNSATTSGESLLTNLIISEEQTRQSQQAQINDVLVAALAKLDGKHNNTSCTTKQV